jgi:2-methylisocitrate lyase-like PEP mutase family enzyme
MALSDHRTTFSRMSLQDRAVELRRLHDDPELLVLVNVWDVASARVVADLPGCAAIATASYAIAGAYGYGDGEQIPRELMIAAIARIAAAVTLPVTADLEAGYGDVDATVRAAIGAGAVGANLEDAMRPLDESVRAVEVAVRAGAAEGVPFVLNARTDVFFEPDGRSPAECVDEAVRRGRAYLDAGATCVFVPGELDAATAAALVTGIGIRKVSVLAYPGGASPAEFAAAGVTRISYGPWPQFAALNALGDVGSTLLAGQPLPDGIRPM